MRHLMPLLAAAALVLSTGSASADLGDQLFKLLADQDDDACPGDPKCESGSAYLFDTTTGDQIAKLLPDDGAAIDFFGHSVAISGATAIVGAAWDDDYGILNQ